MGKYYDALMQDIRFREGLNACMGCGVCTAVCPAAEFYVYDPRQIVLQVEGKDDESIEKLLKSDIIWYCGECMSCRPRCPRANTPAYIIQALRALSQKLGFFVYSEKGRQQLAIKRTIGENIATVGYCITPRRVDPALHLEQGPVWKWVYDNDQKIYDKLAVNYNKSGAGNFRKLDDDVTQEIDSIFEVTGGKEFFKNIEKYSDEYAREMGFDGANDEYVSMVYTANNGQHNG